jgi:uncharacterized surface protein with fasciclin (FAS1) repeats
MPLIVYKKYYGMLPLAGLLWILCIGAVGASFSSCKKTMAVSSAVPDSVYYGRLQFVIQDNATFSYFTLGYQTGGWLDTLGQPGPYTVVLPDNDAFSAGYQDASYSTQNFSSFFGSISYANSNLIPYLGNSILKGRISFRSLPLGDNQPLPNLFGTNVYVTRYLSGSDTMTTVDGQPVISLDNPATNGLIQVLSGIPIPAIYPTVMQRIQSDSNMALFAFALQRVHLDSLLEGKDPYTVFAPVNVQLGYASYPPYNIGMNLSSLDSIAAADTARLRAFLSYYILPGRYFLNDFRRQMTTDTLNLTMLNGEVMKFTNYPAPGIFPIANLAPGFTGLGNLRNPQLSIYQQVCPIYAPVATAQGSNYISNYRDWPVGNGVVHTINGALIP